MQKFKVAACLEIGFYLEIEATDQKSAEALMMDMIKDEDIPTGATTVHRDYFIYDTMKLPVPPVPPGVTSLIVDPMLLTPPPIK